MAQIFMAGAASGSIMPRPEAVDNSLHSQMTVRLDEVGSPLEVKVLALSLGGRSVVLVVLDDPYTKATFGEQLSRAIREANEAAMSSCFKEIIGHSTRRIISWVTTSTHIISREYLPMTPLTATSATSAHLMLA